MPSESTEKDTSEISRDHTVMVSESGLITVAGGKWTTYRKMGKDTVDQATTVGELEERPSYTESLHLEGWRRGDDLEDPWKVYGADAEALRAIEDEDHVPEGPMHPDLPYHACQYVWAVREELARTVEDALARRTRALLLDADAAVEIAPEVARLMAEELGEDEAWIDDQVAEFEAVAEGYQLHPHPAS
jgi:glycerol-3-phosphate dehydrogenase